MFRTALCGVEHPFPVSDFNVNMSTPMPLDMTLVFGLG